MATHGIRTLVTENGEDFAAFHEIQAVTIVDLVEGV